MTDLLFKFRLDTDHGERERVLSVVREAGARAVEPLFPAEDDDELARMYVAQCDDDDVARLFAMVLADPAVESAEEPPRRRLIR